MGTAAEESAAVPDITLHQFLYSHYNEKARWALAFKGLPHERVAYLPGPHMRAIRRLSGQTATPVLGCGSEVIAGSAAIIDRLERMAPEPPLYPADPAQREAALALQREFDDEVGPAVRTALFSVMIDHGGYITNMFARDAGGLKKALYGAFFPLARGLIAEGNGLNIPGNIDRCFELAQATLDRVAAAVEETGYLVGESFTVADLTAAALLAPMANPDHPDMNRPQPLPDSVARFLERWAGHDAIAWVKRMYSLHR